MEVNHESLLFILVTMNIYLVVNLTGNLFQLWWHKCKLPRLLQAVWEWDLDLAQMLGPTAVSCSPSTYPVPHSPFTLPVPWNASHLPHPHPSNLCACWAWPAHILPWPWQCRVASASPLTSLGDWHESALWHFCDTDPSECSQFFVFTKYSCWGYVPLCVRLEEGEPCPSSSTSSKIASPKLLFL